MWKRARKKEVQSLNKQKKRVENIRELMTSKENVDAVTSELNNLINLRGKRPARIFHKVTFTTR